MDIVIGNEYLNCTTCHKNFLTNVTYSYIENKKICPHCKQQWKNNNIYINEEISTNQPVEII
jgi:phage FluMu protein Com